MSFSMMNGFIWSIGFSTSSTGRSRNSLHASMASSYFLAPE